MEEALYMNDSYLKEFEAEVVSVSDGKYVVLNRTVFYPNGGGQPCDTGILTRADGKEFKVVYVGKFGGRISHEVQDKGLEKGDKVRGVIDWERRYVLMRYHTAAHILSGVFHKECGAKITGNQLNTEKGRIDFNLEEFDREKIKEYFDLANRIVQEDRPVVVSFMQREEALKDPDLFKLAGVLPPDVEELRIVEIKNFDRQADGGTHVKSTGEVGKIIFLKAENKGKNNRRVYFKLE